MGGRFLSAQISLSQCKEILKGIFRYSGETALFSQGLDEKNFWILAAGILLLIATAVIETRENLFVWFRRQNKFVCAIILYIMFFTVFLLGIYGTAYDTSSFIYQQF